MLNLLTSIRSSSRQPGERLPGEYRNFSSRVDIPLLCTVLCGGLSGKNTFSLLSVFKRRRNFVCNWSPPVPLGGPEIVRLWGTGTRRGLLGGSAGGSVCCGLRIPSTAKQRTALRLAKLHVAKYAQNMSPQKVIRIFVARFSSSAKEDSCVAHVMRLRLSFFKFQITAFDIIMSAYIMNISLGLYEIIFRRTDVLTSILFVTRDPAAGRRHRGRLQLRRRCRLHRARIAGTFSQQSGRRRTRSAQLRNL